MDNRYCNSVIGEMKPFFEEHGFVSRDDGSYRGEKKAFRVDYSEDRQMYLLMAAEVEDGVVSEYTEISSWLFDDTQNEKDAASVGVDFTATMRDTLGIKIKRAKVSEIDLPSADKGGALTVSGFTKKVLDVFPQYKETYKAHVAKYGNFLYLQFYSETLVPQIRGILNENAKKTVKKLFDLLDTGYIQGDKETVTAIVAVVAAAVYNDEKLKAAAVQMLEGDKHFQSSLTSFLPAFAHNKKLIATLVQ